MGTEDQSPSQLSNEELAAALRDAHKDILDLQAQLAEYRWVEEALRKRTRSLSERVKELDCLYSISDRLRHPEVALPQLLQEIVNTIPKGYQWPARTSVLLSIADRLFCSSHAQETSCRHAAHIHVQRKRAGVIEVFVEPPAGLGEDAGVLPEEEALLDAIALWIGEIVEHREKSG